MHCVVDGARVVIAWIMRLDDLAPDDVHVQLVHGKIDSNDVLTDVTVRDLELGESYDGGRYRFDGDITLDRGGPFEDVGHLEEIAQDPLARLVFVVGLLATDPLLVVVELGRDAQHAVAQLAPVGLEGGYALLGVQLVAGSAGGVAERSG